MTRKGLDSVEQVALWSYKAINNRARRLIGNSTDADDLTQQTYLRFFEYYKEKGEYDVRNVKGALYSLLWNVFRDLIEHKNCKLSQRMKPLDNVVYNMAGNSLDPLGRMLMQENEDRVRSELAPLPERQREIILKHYFEGYKAREIAEQLGISTNIILAELFKGRKELKGRMRAIAA